MLAGCSVTTHLLAGGATVSQQAAAPGSLSREESRKPILPGAPLSKGPSFKNDVAPLLSFNCSGCHGVGGAGGVSLADKDHQIIYANVADNFDRLLDSMESGRMPMFGEKLTVKELKMLQAWHKVGKPNN